MKITNKICVSNLHFKQSYDYEYEFKLPHSTKILKF